MTSKFIISGLAALACLFAATAKCGATAPDAHMVLTCNIRVALAEDDAAGYGWAARKDLCAEIIRSRNPDIVCMQEVLRVQNKDLKKLFPGYMLFGFEGPEMDAHQDDGYYGIAKNVIMFSTKRYELVSAGGFWLSETPHLPGSASWETARARHVNWVRLKERASGVEFRVVNTHLDHKGQKARVEQIKMIMAESALYPAVFPQIFAGDFNAHGDNPVYDIIKQAGWTDSYDAVHPEGYRGYTAHGFMGPDYAKKLKPERLGKDLRIDHIFLRGPVRADAGEVIVDSKNGKYPSDHYFLSARILISKQNAASQAKAAK